MPDRNRERLFLREFLAQTPAFEGYAIDESWSERPDFLIRRVDGSAPTVGFELTEYYQGPRRRRGGSERRAAEGYCQKFRQRLAERFSSGELGQDLQRRHGWIKFRRHGRPIASYENGFLTDLTALVRGATDGHDYETGELRTLTPSFAEWVERLRVDPVDGLILDEPWECLNCSGGAVGITLEELDACLRTKLGLAGPYRSNISMDRLNLLVVAAGLRISESGGSDLRFQSVIPEVRLLAESLGFDEIFFYCRDGQWSRRVSP